ncbi:MAG: choline-sulfatase [Candidatus Latescibacterota bacterium]|nr:choline-sulfatase [Candidatus Latescibacterota bacterium]
MSERPNILLIISDQMIAALTGAYGHPVVKTAALERLCAEGIRFDAAYTPYPLCAPARACLMSGRYASVNGCIDNGAPLREDLPTFAHYLTNAGYDTVLSGKMHFVGADQLHGFNRRLTTDIYPPDFGWVKPEWVRMKETRGEGYEEIMAERKSYNAASYTGDAVHVDEWNSALSYDEETHFRALEYLHAKGVQSGPGKEQPFLLCASYHHPHEVFWPPREYWDLYEGEEIAIPEFPEDLADSYSIMDKWLNAYHGIKRYDLRDPDGLYKLRRAYYGLVSYMDRKVGELLDALTENGLDANTVVIFISDHGDMLCEKEMVQKRVFYEWSSRVPFIARFPDGRSAGWQCGQPVSLLDLLPTMCELAGVRDLLDCDGQSLMGLVDGSDREEEGEVMAEMHEVVGTPCFMIRRGKYKYVHIHDHEGQLFDLEADPGEWNNLAGRPECAQVEAELRARILATFDPEAIGEAARESLQRRDVIRKAMQANGTSWDHQPQFDGRKNSLAQYLPARGNSRG